MSGLEQFSDTYTIIEKLGEGSGGVVYKAYHKRLCKEVVLKKMKSKSASNMINRKEVDILKNLNHSFLPQVLDFLTVGDDVYTVMSYIPGKSFQQLLKEGYSFSQNQLIYWGMQLLSALNYLHSQNPPIIHSDIKPANIMLTPEGNICLIDFNISFFLDENTVLGYSSGYTSPEQYVLAMDSRTIPSVPKHSKIDIQSDIYSVGATFYHLVTGIRRNNYNEPINEEILEERTSEAFAKVITRAMKTNPKDRYESAFEMFQALQGVTKRDKRYRKLLRKQRIIRCGLVGLLAGFIVLGGFGIHELQLERVDKYNGLVKQQITYQENEDYEKAEEVYQEAKTLIPSELETYYQNAYMHYQQREYEECIKFIDYDILENEKIDLEQQKMADVYYLKADSYFQLEEYQEAVSAYKKLMKIGTTERVYYRDYAIALAYNGDSTRAEEVLQEAIDQGLMEDSIFYAKGEIEKSLSEMNAALLDLKKCIDVTDDNNLKARAYVLCSKIYEEQENRVQERKILLEAENALPVANQMLILERLIQVDIYLAESTGSSDYQEEAVEKLNKVISQNWDTYVTYDNLVIMYENIGELDKAQETIQIMKDKYGEDYNTYKRLAFIEIEKQELLENSKRNYAQFAEYYKTASEMYNEQLENNNIDAEMGLLDNVYQQVVSGGWL